MPFPPPPRPPQDYPPTTPPSPRTPQGAAGPAKPLSSPPPQADSPRARPPPLRAHSPPPRARSPPPRAHSPPPRAHLPRPRARSPPPRAHSPPPRARSPPPRAAPKSPPPKEAPALAQAPAPAPAPAPASSPAGPTTNFTEGLKYDYLVTEEQTKAGLYVNRRVASYLHKVCNASKQYSAAVNEATKKEMGLEAKFRKDGMTTFVDVYVQLQALMFENSRKTALFASAVLQEVVAPLQLHHTEAVEQFKDIQNLHKQCFRSFLPLARQRQRCAENWRRLQAAQAKPHDSGQLSMQLAKMKLRAEQDAARYEYLRTSLKGSNSEAYYAGTLELVARLQALETDRLSALRTALGALSTLYGALDEMIPLAVTFKHAVASLDPQASISTFVQASAAAATEGGLHPPVPMLVGSSAALASDEWTSITATDEYEVPVPPDLSTYISKISTLANSFLGERGGERGGGGEKGNASDPSAGREDESESHQIKSATSQISPPTNQISPPTNQIPPPTNQISPSGPPARSPPSGPPRAPQLSPPSGPTPSPRAASPPMSSPRMVLVGKWDYPGTGDPDYDLLFAEGDRIQLTEPSSWVEVEAAEDTMWCMGTLLPNGPSGGFPSNYVGPE